MDFQLQRTVHKSQNRVEAYHQLRAAIAKIGGKKKLYGKTNIDIEIEKQYLVATGNKHTQSALKALELLSRVRGAKSDKSENISTESLEEEVMECIKILGKKKIMEFIKKCGF